MAGFARRMPSSGGAPLGGGTLPLRLMLAGGGADGGGGARLETPFISKDITTGEGSSTAPPLN